VPGEEKRTELAWTQAFLATGDTAPCVHRPITDRSVLAWIGIKDDCAAWFSLQRRAAPFLTPRATIWLLHRTQLTIAKEWSTVPWILCTHKPQQSKWRKLRNSIAWQAFHTSSFRQPTSTPKTTAGAARSRSHGGHEIKVRRQQLEDPTPTDHKALSQKTPHTDDAHKHGYRFCRKRYCSVAKY
jgi:hypothetical protein